MYGLTLTGIGFLYVGFTWSDPQEQIAEAHAYVEKGHKKGNVAIEVS